MLPCGCEHVCCGICEHAARAGRPRLFTRESAAQWDPPNLTDYRGADKLEARNGDSGEPTMWFWQMTGTRWPAHDKRESRTTFNTATKAWRRLTASQEERSAETAARYDREDARLELEAAEELRVVEEEQRVLEEKCKQEAREQQQQQRRRRAEEAASRVHAARNRVRELPMRPRDASPRIALLAALRGVTGNRLCDWAWVESDPIGSSRVRYSVRDSSPRLELPLDEPDEMMARIVAASGSDERPPWADWWPSPSELVGNPLLAERARAWSLERGRSPEPEPRATTWALQQVIAARRGWDGTWSGMHVSGGEETERNAFRWRRDTLRLRFIECCLAPTALPALLDEPDLPDSLWEAEPGSINDEELAMLERWERVDMHNELLREYSFCYKLFFTASAAAAASLPPLAPGAHAWAASVLRQAACGEREPLKLVGGKWACDVHVSSNLKLALEPLPPRFTYPVATLPAAIAAIGEACNRNRWSSWPPRSHCESELPPAPCVQELSRYFQGSFTAASTGIWDKSKLFPASFDFHGGYPQRHPARAVPTHLPQPEHRTVSRVSLNLSVFLRTRGSHCHAGVAAVANYIAARRAELARQSQRELQRRKAEIAEEKRKQEQDQKRKQAAADARKRKREREDELIRLQLEERHERLREKERARLRARYGDAWSEGAPEVPCAVALSVEREGEGSIEGRSCGPSSGPAEEPCSEGPLYALGLPPGFDDSVVPSAC
ncbi:hypothetical protein EMIHUDRAFT_122307 [Emiliania huxleyi CCMP1516]|uniref:Uncharacterized protein n=2 Tax=Emiliania huxleyi TaxID=2903 RepID=A0A0D3KPR3_EMIH1|nr:hypothetical protein EMIHUDRAFT_122307 [Emiliania huxleyi CCMP1516]EOD37748.1 hypothetical protein EMIHUDRAFT_122307 [Emiliania huxleyi CCMP1516]|eukprot:XP_005790177.1 hypothetical protein EMIHUDRAFT_122307 [Emiliania huxleyi CCMP1516]